SSEPEFSCARDPPRGNCSEALVLRRLFLVWRQFTACSPRPSSSRRVFHQAGLLALPVAILFGGALVVFLLALRQADAQFGAAVLPVHLQRHERVAAALDSADQPIELGAVQQELAGADRVGDDVRRGRRQRRDVRAEQESLSVFHEDVRFLQLHAPGAQALHFPPQQRQACLVGFLDEVLVTRLAILGDRRIVVGGALLAHIDSRCRPWIVAGTRVNSRHASCSGRMKEVKRSALVPYAAEQMFALVEDIESYPQFLPWVSAAKLLERGPNQVVGQLEM